MGAEPDRNTLVLPILTYGFPLYSTQHHIISLLNILQIAQNDAVRKISGCFKTTPIIPLYYLTAIPPIKLTIKKLTSQFKIRVANLPPTHLLHTITTFNPAADWHLSTNPETALTRILPAHSPFFTFPSHPSQSKWVHPQVRDNTIFAINPATKESTQSLICLPPHNSYSIFIRMLTVPSPPFAAGFVVYQGKRLVHSGTTRAPTRPGALLQVLLQGLTYASFSNEIHIFIPDCSTSTSVFLTSKHPFLFLSCAIIDQMIAFLLAHSLHSINFYRYSVKWAGLPGKMVFEEFTNREQHIIFPVPPPSLLCLKDVLLHDLQDEYIRTICLACIWQSITMPDGHPPPFIQGALSQKDRRTYVAAGQLASSHAFHKPYSVDFQPGANDNNICPCSNPTPPSSPSGSAHSDTSGFNRLQAEHLARSHLSPLSPCSTPYDSLPRHQHQRPRPRCTRFPNSTAHVLYACPLHTSPRHHIFRLRPSEEFIFGTFEGSAQLGAFQRTTNRLL